MPPGAGGRHVSPGPAARPGVHPRRLGARALRLLGRPGAVLVDGEIAGLWRPRASGAKLRLLVTPWRSVTPALRASITDQAERLAAFRQIRLVGVELDD
nr:MULTISPECIES: crosslink repair DNA glycosylase YcaQ family protein [Frankia]